MDEQRETLLDFTGVDAEFLVEKATGQVVDQYRAVAGAWRQETQREIHEDPQRMETGGHKSQVFFNSAASALQQDQSEGVSVTALCVSCHSSKCGWRQRIKTHSH